MEATMYALLAGFQNFGGEASSSLDALASDLTGINMLEDKPRHLNRDHARAGWAGTGDSSK